MNAANGKVRTPEQLWCKLTDNQRLYLINQVVPQRRRTHQPHAITAGRALERLGLDYHPTPTNRALAEWAMKHGYARQDGPPVRGQYAMPGTLTVPSWTFTAPQPARIPVERLRDLASKSLHASAIARELGVTREAVRQAALRHGVTIHKKWQTT